jgi:hypothetical protein
LEDFLPTGGPLWFELAMDPFSWDSRDTQRRGPRLLALPTAQHVTGQRLRTFFDAWLTPPQLPDLPAP